MGFLSGLLGGGSKTNVTQQATTTSQVDVNVDNKTEVIIDTEILAKALKEVGSLSAESQTLLANVLGQAAVVEANSSSNLLGFAQNVWAQTQKAAMWAGLGLLVWWMFKKG
jgi:hypothetical protein